MDHRELMMKRIEDIGLRLEEVYKREKGYIKDIINKKTIECNMKIEELGLLQCWASNKRKIANPTFVKINKYSVFKYYINLEVVFRDKEKK